MLESLTLVSLLSSAPAALKFAHDALELWGKVKALRDKPVRLLIEGDAIGRFEKRQLDAMYQSIDRARPMAADVAGRVFRSYLFRAIVLLSALVAASALLALLPALLWIAGGIAVMLIAGPFLVQALRPVWRLVPDDYAQHLSEGVTRANRGIDVAWRDAQMSARATAVSIPERAFLNAYITAESMIRALECGVHARALQKSIATAHEVLTGRVFDEALNTIERLARDGQLDEAEERKEVLRREFAAMGMADLVDPVLVGEEFFEIDFRSVGNDSTKLRNTLGQFWAQRART